METMKNNSEKIHAETRIGHVHLKVSDLERSVKFYSDFLGFEITAALEGAVFLSAGGYHHHIGLNTWESKGGAVPEPGNTGLYHFAILVPSRKELAKVFKRLMDKGWPIEGASDHGVSEAIYLKDPDGNGVEIYCDRPREQWPKGAKGRLEMFTKKLDIDGLMGELK